MINKCTSYPIREIGDILTRIPFNYQKQNYSWMIDIENRVANNNLGYQTYEIATNMDIKSYYVEAIDEYLVMDANQGKMIDTSSLPVKNFVFKGGVLADEVGLGKTFSMISLIQYQLIKARARAQMQSLGQNQPINPTLIICPRRLCLQWQEEIKASSTLRSYIIHSITQFKKLTLETVKNYDVVIMSYQFLTNKKYLEHRNELSDNDNENENNNHLPYNWVWERLILDEGHEYITNSKSLLNKAHHRDTMCEIYRLNSKYRWICSGTPVSSYLDFWETINFLSARAIKTSNYNDRSKWF